MTAVVELLKSKNKLICDQAESLKEKDKQIQALSALLADPKCNALHSSARKTPKSEQNSDTLPQGRGGWRARAQILSDRTIPKTGDSVGELQERVLEQGGTV